MDTLASSIAAIVAAANTLTPLALVGLVIGVLYIQIYKQPSKHELNIVKDNHLEHVAESLQRIELSLASNFATVISKLDNKK